MYTCIHIHIHIHLHIHVHVHVLVHVYVHVYVHIHIISYHIISYHKILFVGHLSHIGIFVLCRTNCRKGVAETSEGLDRKWSEFVWTDRAKVFAISCEMLRSIANEGMAK